MQETHESFHRCGWLATDPIALKFLKIMKDLVLIKYIKLFHKYKTSMEIKLLCRCSHTLSGICVTR